MKLKSELGMPILIQVGLVAVWLGTIYLGIEALRNIEAAYAARCPLTTYCPSIGLWTAYLGLNVFVASTAFALFLGWGYQVLNPN